MSPGLQTKKLRIGEILVKAQLITPEQCAEALKAQKEIGKRLGQVCIDKGWIEEKDLINALSRQLKIPHVWLRRGLVDPKIISILPYEKAQLLHVLPLFKVKNMLTVATSDPHALLTLDELERLTGCKVQAVLSRSSDIEKAIEESYGEQVDIPDYIDTLEEGELTLEVDHSVHDLQTVVEMAEGNSVIHLVNNVLIKAIRDRVSDIHIEPGRKTFRIRYRIDGILYEAFVQKMEIHPAVVSRLKIMAGLDIAERRLPQDGRIQVTVDKKSIDFRFSSLLGIFGEKVVLRILDKSRMVLDLDQLGFAEKTTPRLKKMLKRPFGLFLTTGPTGSGKTTTLYSAISFLNSMEKNIVTIEDPVEYQLELINQNQVKETIGLTFAKILKHVLRQNPDIIMVGEIRDKETAEIAIQASLTGHLVLSTLHTNDSLGAVTRFLEMGIDPYLIASTLIGVVAQRLARTICTECKTFYYPSKEVVRQFDWNDKLRLAHGKGCPSCYDSGYRGQCGLYEFLEVDEPFRELILSNPTFDDLRRYREEKGIFTLYQEGLKKVQAGETTLEELSRAISAGG